MGRPWLWGVGLGASIGGAVVLLSAFRYGFSPQLLLLGIVLALACGGLAVAAGIARTRPGID